MQQLFVLKHVLRVINEIQAENLVHNIHDTTIIADRGYDSNAFIKYLSENNCDYVIPPRKNRKFIRTYDKHIYKERHLIECFFGKIKYFRRIFSRFDKTASSYLGFLQFVWRVDRRNFPANPSQNRA